MDPFSSAGSEAAHITTPPPPGGSFWFWSVVFWTNFSPENIFPEVFVFFGSSVELNQKQETEIVLQNRDNGIVS